MSGAGILAAEMLEDVTMMLHGFGPEDVSRLAEMRLRQHLLRKL